MFKQYATEIVKNYGDISVLILLILEFLGVPVPGEPLMSLLGYFKWNADSSNIVIPVIFSMTGTMIGCIIAYILGYKYGEQLLLKYGKYIFLTKEKIDKTKAIFTKNKTMLLLFSRFVPGVRHVVPYLSGISKLSFKQFLPYNIIGSFIWCTTFIGIGFFFADKMELIEHIIKVYSMILIVAIVGTIVAIKLFPKFKKMILVIASIILIIIILFRTFNTSFLEFFQFL